MGLGGSNPRFMLFWFPTHHSCPFTGSRTGGSAPSLIPKSEAGCMLPCISPLAPSSVTCMQTAAIVTETLLSMLRLYTCPGDPALWGSISSSSAQLYFLGSIIISPVSLPAHVLEPLNFYPTHPSWPLTLEPSINSCLLS